MNLNPEDPIQMGVMALLTVANECNQSNPKEAKLSQFLNHTVACMQGQQDPREMLQSLAKGLNAIISTLDGNAGWHAFMIDACSNLFDGVNLAFADAYGEIIQKAQLGDPITSVLVFETLSPDNPTAVSKDASSLYEQLAALSEDDDWQVRAGVASNPSTPRDLLRKLAQDQDEGVRSYTARNENTPIDALEALSSDSSEYVRDFLAQNPALPLSLMEKLANDLHWRPRSGVAENPNATPTLIEKLKNDTDERVREIARRHPLSDGGSDYFFADMSDYENTVAWHAGDSQAPVEIAFPILIADRQNRPLYSVLIEESEKNEKISDFLLSVKQSYFLIEGILGNNEHKVAIALQAGADPNKRILHQSTLHTPIIAAAISGNTNIVKLLLDAGANVNQPQSNSETALGNAANRGDCPMVSFLLEHGADPDTVTHAGTALALADNLAVVMLLDAYNANPNIPDPDGDLPIIGFIDQGRYEIVNLLVGMGTDLQHQNKKGETAIDRVKRRGNQTMFDIVVNNVNYEQSCDVSIPDDYAAALEDRIAKFLRLSYPLDSYRDNEEIGRVAESLGDSQPASEEEIIFKAVYDFAGSAIDAKRQGDLNAANDAYLKMFEYVFPHSSQYTWGWFKVLTLAKNFKDAYLILRYYHAESASMNTLLRDAGQLDFENTPIKDSFLTLDFDVLEVFQDCTRVWQLDRDALTEKIRAYGGSPQWSNYTLSDEEYDSFLRYFVYDGIFESKQEDAASLHDQIRHLEEEVRSGSADAAFDLANLLQNDDPEKANNLYRQSADAGNKKAQVKLASIVMNDESEEALRLCEEAYANGERDESPFLLAYLLTEKDPERSKELYEYVVAQGSYYGAANNLANLIKADDPERAAELFQLAIDAGNTNLAAKNLADLIKDTDPVRAAKLYEMAIDEGNVRECAYNLANMIRASDTERAKSLYQMAIDAGDEFAATFELARLLEQEDSARAQALYQRSIDAGDTRASTFFLANLIRDDDPARAIELYQQSANAGSNDACVALARMVYEDDKERAIALCEEAVSDGDTNDGTFFLAWLLRSTDPERSKDLYQKCIDAGFVWGAARNLGSMIKDEDPQRAAELYDMALQAGDKEMRVPLARLIASEDRKRAIDLCEEAVADGDENEGAFYLAWLLESTDPERSKELYQKCIDAGNVWGAANNLAELVRNENPELAEELYKRAISSGNPGLPAQNLARLYFGQKRYEEARAYSEMAYKNGQGNSFGFLIDYGAELMLEDRNAAVSILKEAMEKGDQIYSPCNLAHICSSDNPSKAKELYGLSIEHEQNSEATEAYIGLALLLKKDNEEKSKELLSIAKERHNYDAAVEFMLDYYDANDPSHAEHLRRFLC